jgi:DNA polymerase-4
MTESNTALPQHKIIHIDMDCFYAAIEIRDNPSLRDKPVAVGGSAERRGVLCTCNYIARKYGIHSAMPTAYAQRLCKDLVLLPVDMPKYKAVAKRIHAIFHKYSAYVEPLSLDEAYIDVTHSEFHQGSATLIAEAIRAEILAAEQLTASAGVAPNKLLAKIASGWKKPNGLFVIRPQEVAEFIEQLAVKELFGVGKVTAHKLQQLHVKTCADLQKFSLAELTRYFGKMGQRLYEQCRGLDSRKVEADRVRKSLSVEETFVRDISDVAECEREIEILFQRLQQRINNLPTQLCIKNQYLKIKFNDFKQLSAEMAVQVINLDSLLTLFHKVYANQGKPIRLLGLGVHFASRQAAASTQYIQQSFDDLS